ncbi:DUF2182 domain-containing protein [Streptomyces sp. NPDC004044]
MSSSLRTPPTPPAPQALRPTSTPQQWTRRVGFTTAIWVCAASALAWWWMLGGHHAETPGGHDAMAETPGMADMPGMAHHSAGSAGQGASAAEAGMFLVMWTGMVVAMMFPVAIPLIAAHRFITRTRGARGKTETGCLVAGYLLAWVLAGTVPLLLMVGKRAVLPESFDGPWRVASTGLVLATAGLFQFSGLKTRCLTVCRSPLQFVLTHDFAAGAAGALRAGVLNGLYCLGCCWALMLVQVAVGLDNIAWMGTLTLLFLAERTLRRGAAVARLTGTVMTVLGAVLIMEPLQHTPLANLI